MNNNELIAQLKAAASKKEKAKIYGDLFKNNSGAVATMCNKWINKIKAYSKDFSNSIVEFDDLFQECYFALVQAADAYSNKDCDTQAEFITYLVNSINWHFINYFKLKHRYINDECHILRLDQSIDPSDKESPSLVETIPSDEDTEKDVINRLYSIECEDIFLDTIKNFPARKKDILIRYILLGQSYSKISKVYGISSEAVRLDYVEGIKLLNASNIRRRLSENNDNSDIESIAFRSSGFKFWKEHNNTSSVELAAMLMEKRRKSKQLDNKDCKAILKIQRRLRHSENRLDLAKKLNDHKLQEFVLADIKNLKEKLNSLVQQF